MTEIQDLPEGCIATIVSRTTPVDASRLSVVSNTFRSASDSDAVWNRFLPSDISSIISHSPSLANIPTKKDLYLALSDRPLIIDHDKKMGYFDMLQSAKGFRSIAYRLRHAAISTKDKEK